jgi:hypothetical protein
VTAIAQPEVGDVSELADRTGAADLYSQARAVAAAALDAVADTRSARMMLVSDAFERRGEVALQVGTPSGPIVLDIAPTAHKQIAEKVGIPLDYYNRMKAGQPDLLAVNVNRWLEAEPSRHLFRLLRPVTEDHGRAAEGVGAQFRLRAVLSSRFRPLDNAALLDAILPVAADKGARVAETKLADDRFYLRLVTEEKSLADIRAAHGYDADRYTGHKFVNEVLSTGVAIQNSETGFGALAVEPFVRIVRCLNGLIVSEKVRAIHVGRDKEDGFLQADTRALEDAAVFLRIRDKVLETFGGEVERKALQAIEAGVTNALTLPADLPLFEFVGNVGVAFDLSKAEAEILREETSRDLIAGQYETGFNQFALSQGVTALARRVGDEGGDFDRRVELERIGWEVLTSPVARLLDAGKARAAKAATN